MQTNILDVWFVRYLPAHDIDICYILCYNAIMLKDVQKIYPSSNVPAEEIAAYGWKLVDQFPAVVNDAGRLAPAPERSALHSKLRAHLDEYGTAVYGAQDGTEIKITDFAVAHSPNTPGDSPSTEKALGFFVLQ